MFGRETITLGIGPHSSSSNFSEKRKNDDDDDKSKQAVISYLFD